MRPGNRFPKTPRLINARYAARLTQTALAASIGVHPTSVREWERLKRGPHPSQLIALANQLNTTTNYLLGREERPEAPAPEDFQEQTT
jgi:transcriptional regulator with XRE-family HTH domain